MALLVLVLVVCGYSFAQEPEAEASPPQPQPQPQPQILSPQEIPQGFAAQLKAAQQAQPDVKPKATAEAPPQKGGYPSYEAYLDSIELIAKLLFNAKNKKMMDKLTSTIRQSQDIQPEWGGLLRENAQDINEYKKRIDIFNGKISDMNVMSARINSLLAKLNIDSSDIKKLEKKNMLYVKRMERASELMSNYMLKEEAQVLSTERKNFSTTLGEYNEDKGELQINVKDFGSNVPFDYHGVIKMNQRLAETIDNESDGFTAIIDYLNYPFVVDGVKMYPGAKKAHIYYEDNEINVVGAFKAIEGFDWREGYSQWATRADSLLTGKLKYRNLDSSYAMKKVRVGPPFWTAKRIFRATAFVLSAASLGLGYWQNSVMKSKTKEANELYNETLKAAITGDAAHKDKAQLYDDKVNSLEKSKFARNGLYISAGAFGVAGMASFFF